MHWDGEQREDSNLPSVTWSWCLFFYLAVSAHPLRADNPGHTEEFFWGNWGTLVLLGKAPGPPYGPQEVPASLLWQMAGVGALPRSCHGLLFCCRIQRANIELEFN